MSQQEKDKPGYRGAIFKPAFSDGLTQRQDLEEFKTVVVELGQGRI